MFTYEAYENMIKTLQNEGFQCCSFKNYNENKDEKRTAVLRHDIDLDLAKGKRMAQLEYNIGVTATYFVMLSSQFYNLFSRQNEKLLHEIRGLNHEIGLHFDESKYGNNNLSDEEFVKWLEKEIKVLEDILGEKVTSISMHIPNQRLFGHKLPIHLINAYDEEFTHEFKYLSDSMMRYREPVLDIIKSGKYDKIQLLTHPIWYEEEGGKDANSILENLYEKKKSNLESYLHLIKPDLNLLKKKEGKY